jgi:hypothetical protein
MIGGVFGFLAGFQVADSAARDAATYTVTTRGVVQAGATEVKDRECGYEGTGDNRRYRCHDVYICDYSYTYVHNNDAEYSGSGKTERRSSCLSSFAEGNNVAIWYDPSNPADHVRDDPNGWGKSVGPWALWIISSIIFVAGASVGVYAVAERRHS